MRINAAGYTAIIIMAVMFLVTAFAGAMVIITVAVGEMAREFAGKIVGWGKR
jgi:hypothetical protein